ncbi:hypothetical protein [Streptomyces sp. NPDC048508]|uniref:hypothetical protein n=1 Tax=Streptomyces sp. NPDC048508 TaxID=3365561 RepID=UPI00371B858F
MIATATSFFYDDVLGNYLAALLTGATAWTVRYLLRHHTARQTNHDTDTDTDTDTE